MTCEERRDILIPFLLGSAEPAEAAEFQAHLARGCPLCAGALAEAEATLHQLPLALKTIAAPAGAWESIESRLSLREQLEPGTDSVPAVLTAPFTPPKRSTAWIGWAVAAAVAIAIGIPLWNAQQQLASDKNQIATLRSQTESIKDLQGKVDDLNTQLTTLRNQNEQNRLQLASYQQEVDLMMHADSFAVASPEQKDAQGRLFWDKNGKTLTLCVSKAQNIPDGKTYQLWILPKDGKPIPRETVSPDKSGLLMLTTKIPDDAAAFTGAAVTIEPAGGSQTPTMPIQFVANVTPS